MIFQLSKKTSDVIKIMAALIVMMHHYAQYICANHLSDSIIYRILSFQCGYLGVAIFFFLSGFGLMESEQKNHLGILEFLKRRIFKVYLPVLAASVIWMVISPFLLSISPFSGDKIGLWGRGGGKWLIVSDVLVGFGDDVLWFIKILILLYALFYLYCFIRNLNHIASNIFLIATATIATIFTVFTIGSFASISVPVFFLGIILSQHKKSIFPIMILIGSISLSEFIFLSSHYLVIHAFINLLAIAMIILAFSLKKIELRIPSIVTAVSFDIYLVHNKVLMTMKNNADSVELLPFIIITVVTTIGFYIVRTKLLHIK